MNFSGLHISLKVGIIAIGAGLVAIVQKPEFVLLLPAVVQPLWPAFINAAAVAVGAYLAPSPMKKEETK